jgi:hypothetical protein
MDDGAKREKPGKEYEQIVAAIHRQFAGDAKVTENEIITGKSGQPRQIDVAIRTTVDGAYPILVIIECKDYTRAVGIGKVDELIGKIDDVQAVMGVLVSNSGFTEDANHRAAQDVRVQLASVVDVENEKVRAQVAIPFMMDYRAPEFQIFGTVIGTRQFAADAAFMTNLKRRFLTRWNDGELSIELGEHQYTEVVHEEPGLRVSITYKYIVKRRLFYGPVKLVRAKGIVNVTMGTFQTSGFTTDVISNADVEQNWQRVNEGNIPFAFMTLIAADMFPLPGEPETPT